MDPTETFTQLPLTIDGTTKLISSTDSSLADELEDLNNLVRAFTQLETPGQITLAPAPVNPKRSVQIQKLKDSGNALYKKGSYPEALKMYELALRMAADRPAWEASGLVREELASMYNNHSQCLMVQQQWPQALVDAEISVEMKRMGNPKAWWRRTQCLREMGRLEEAREVLRNALDFERAGPEKNNLADLETQQRELDQLLAN